MMFSRGFKEGPKCDSGGKCEIVFLHETRKCASCSSGEQYSVMCVMQAVRASIPPGIVFFALARQLPSEMKIMKISPTRDLGENCISCGPLGRGFGEGTECF